MELSVRLCLPHPNYFWLLRSQRERLCRQPHPPPPGPLGGFLADRLAKASAVPAERRSTEVCAFIETCQLQAELVE